MKVKRWEPLTLKIKIVIRNPSFSILLETSGFCVIESIIYWRLPNKKSHSVLSISLWRILRRITRLKIACLLVQNYCSLQSSSVKLNNSIFQSAILVYVLTMYICQWRLFLFWTFFLNFHCSAGQKLIECA